MIIKKYGLSKGLIKIFEHKHVIPMKYLISKIYVIICNELYFDMCLFMLMFKCNLNNWRSMHDDL